MNEEMTQDVAKKIVSTEKYKEIMMSISKIFIDAVVSKSKDNKRRFINKTEYMIVSNSLMKKEIPPIEDLYKLGVNLNSFYLTDGYSVTNLFTSIIMSLKLNDDDTYNLIDRLSKLEFDFNERTIYNGSNALLSLALSFRPKSALKLLEMGVDYNVTNRTMDTLYQSVYDIANYTYPDIYDELLNTYGFYEKKDKIVDEFKKLLKYLDEHNITNDIHDKIFEKIDEYAEEQAKKHNIEEILIKKALYNTAISFSNIAVSKMVNAITYGNLDEVIDN